VSRNINCIFNFRVTYFTARYLQNASLVIDNQHTHMLTIDRNFRKASSWKSGSRP